MADDNKIQNPSNASSQDQQQVGQNPSSAAEDHIVPATGKEKALLAFFLAVTTVLFLCFGEWALKRYDACLTQEVVVQWQAQQGVMLQPGPTSFQMDKKKAALLHRGQINDGLKKELLTLISVDGIPAEQRQQMTDSYSLAIDTLAYLSNANSYLALFFLMVLAGIGGIIGVQIRSISNFIGVTCFKNELDLKRWWPWYVLRPLLGFLFGILVVVLVKAKLFLSAETQVEQGNLWWLGLSVLTGFGASDFSERLRLLTQTLFGKNKG